MKLDRMIAGVGVALFLASVAGCSNPNPSTSETVDAANKTANNTGRAVENAADRSGDAIKDAAKDTTAALVVTPLVKNAITADAKLNDTRNTINVDSKDNVVHLRGTVLNNEMKQHAGEVAQKVLTDNHSTDKLSNELMVKQH